MVPFKLSHESPDLRDCAWCGQPIEDEANNEWNLYCSRECWLEEVADHHEEREED